MRTVWPRIAWLVTVVLPLAFATAAAAGDLDPAAPPAPTMTSLDETLESWSCAIDGPARFKGLVPGIASTGVLDRETGLVWAGAQLPGQTLEAADLACGRTSFPLNATGLHRHGGRLPTRAELTSLLESVNFQPPSSFPVAIGGALLWTSSPVMTATDGVPRFRAVATDSNSPDVLVPLDASATAGALCVRAPVGC